MATVHPICPDVHPGDRVIHADRWQGTLDEPSAEDAAWLAANPTPVPFEPTDQDWDDYRRFCEDVERSDALRRMEDAEYEARMRYSI